MKMNNKPGDGDGDSPKASHLNVHDKLTWNIARAINNRSEDAGDPTLMLNVDVDDFTSESSDT